MLSEEVKRNPGLFMDSISWVMRYTNDGRLTWHQVNGAINKGKGELELTDCFQVVHSKQTGSRFGGAIIGYRGKDKVLCFVLIDGTDNWFYIDAEGEFFEEWLKSILELVKIQVVKRADCLRCRELGPQFSSDWL